MEVRVGKQFKYSQSRMLCQIVGDQIGYASERNSCIHHCHESACELHDWDPVPKSCNLRASGTSIEIGSKILILAGIIMVLKPFKTKSLRRMHSC